MYTSKKLWKMQKTVCVVALKTIVCYYTENILAIYCMVLLFVFEYPYQNLMLRVFTHTRVLYLS